MNKSVKGLLAVGGAAVLLWGSNGSLAFWNDTGTVTGSSLGSGHLNLTGAVCDGWLLQKTAGTTAAFVPGVSHIVPGDTLSRACRFTINAVGDNAAAALTISSPNYGNSNALTSALTTGGTFTVAGQSLTTITEANDGNQLAALLTVQFPLGVLASNLTQDLTAVLNDLTVTLTQVHF